MRTKVTSYLHATYLFEVAVRAAKPEFPDRAGPTIAIMFSAAALEAFINESTLVANFVPTASKQPFLENYSSVMLEAERKRISLEDKYLLAFKTLTNSNWNKGIQPFQDFKLLINLRNEIVHMKGDKWESQIKTGATHPKREPENYPAFISALQGKGIVRKPTKSSAWLELVDTTDVARWACGVAEGMSRHLVQVVPSGYFKEMLETNLLRAGGYPSIERIGPFKPD